MTKWLFESEISDLKIIFRDTGPILMAFGALTGFPALASLFYREFTGALVFLFTGALYIGLGFFFSAMVSEEKTGSAKHAQLSIALVWLIAVFLGGVPFLRIHPPLDALFESAAGFTTTGFTLMEDALEVEKGILLWRSLQPFMGGVFFVTSVLALSKSFDANSDRGLKERMETISLKVLKLYGLFLVAGFLLFLLSGTTVFEALGYSLSSISTGGFSVNGSLGALGLNNSRAVIVSLLLTVLGSMNILLIFKVLEGDLNEVLKNAEILGGILLVAAGTLAAAFAKGDFFIELYHFFAALTTSGFMIVDTPALAGSEGFYKAFLTAIMLIGGSIYSTAGGLKIYRVVVLVKSLYWRMLALLPDKTTVARKIHNIEDFLLSDENLIRVYSFAGFFILAFTASGLVVSAYGYPVLDAFFESASALSNVGLTTGIVSPAMPQPLKLLFIFDMLLGRLEVLGLMVLIFYITGKMKVVTIGR
ncbi:MAG: TrkH family potassium uptake protein [Methanobacteriota archaeon]|nr:MAG: TrkH family potassium uptake protein [Euryarchaeota archaeon]